MIPACLQRHLSTPSSRLAFIPGTVSFSLPCPSAPPARGTGGLFPPSPTAAGIWEGRTSSPDAGRRRVPRYFISADRTVPLQAVTVLYLLPILSKTLKLTLHFISRSDRCQRRGKERALNSPGRHRLGSQRHLCTASKASPWLRHPPKHHECKGKRMHEDQTRVRNAATGTRPPPPPVQPPWAPDRSTGAGQGHTRGGPAPSFYLFPPSEGSRCAAAWPGCFSVGAAEELQNSGKKEKFSRDAVGNVHQPWGDCWVSRSSPETREFTVFHQVTSNHRWPFFVGFSGFFSFLSLRLYSCFKNLNYRFN